VNPDVRWCCSLSQDAWEAGLLSGMCPEGTQCRQGSLDAPDATRCATQVQGAPDAGYEESASGRNTTVSDADHLFADAARANSHISSSTTVYGHSIPGIQNIHFKQSKQNIAYDSIAYLTKRKWWSRDQVK